MPRRIGFKMNLRKSHAEADTHIVGLMNINICLYSFVLQPLFLYSVDNIASNAIHQVVNGALGAIHINV